METAGGGFVLHLKTLLARSVAALAGGLLFGSVVAAAGAADDRSIDVWATAYTSHVDQTDDDPLVGAWGHRLDQVEGARVIAVSPDLLAMGLKRGQRVRIKGLKGEFVVLDKMSSRWTRRIDLYMGMDRHGAKRWGKRRVKMVWKDQDSKGEES